MDKQLPDEQESKKGFRLYGLYFIITCVVFGAGYATGNYFSNVSNTELKQTVKTLEQQNQSQTDTIIKIKLEQKNTVISLQEPVDSIKPLQHTSK